MSSASPIEIAWTSVAILGLLMTTLLLGLAWLTLADIKRQIINGYRRRYARKLVRESLSAFGVFLIFTIVGFIAMATPAPTHAANQHASVVNGSLFVALLLWLVGHTALTLYDEYWVRLRLYAEDKAWKR